MSTSTGFTGRIRACAFCWSPDRETPRQTVRRRLPSFSKGCRNTRPVAPILRARRGTDSSQSAARVVPERAGTGDLIALGHLPSYRTLVPQIAFMSYIPQETVYARSVAGIRDCGLGAARNHQANKPGESPLLNVVDFVSCRPWTRQRNNIIQVRQRFLSLGSSRALASRPRLPVPPASRS
jgi:hypothetical protein